MKKKFFRNFLLLSLNLYLSFLAFGQNENISITTYYPAPYGVYQNLRLFPTTVIPACNANSEGLMYYDNNLLQNQPMVCRETSLGVFNWQSIGGGLWALAGISPNQYIYPNVIDWNVGIGTQNPQERLDIQGGRVRIGHYNLPAADGTADQALVTNGSGTVSWAKTGGDIGLAGHVRMKWECEDCSITFIINTRNRTFSYSATHPNKVSEVSLTWDVRAPAPSITDLHTVHVSSASNSDPGGNDDGIIVEPRDITAETFQLYVERYGSHSHRQDVRASFLALGK